MKTPNEIFDEWLNLSQLPPRYDTIPAQIAGPFDYELALFNRRKRDIDLMLIDGREIELHAGYIDSGRCNAHAGIHEGMGLIALTRGAILIPWELFSRMFSHPKIASWIGNSNAEKPDERHADGVPKNYDRLVARRIRAGRLSIPQEPLDPIRGDVAQMCMELVWSFLIFHETVHIEHGHVEYLASSRGQIPCMLNASANQRPQNISANDLDRQAIELWADAKAVEVGLGGLLTNDNPAVQDLFPTPQDRVFLWSFAIVTLFRIWGLRVNPQNLFPATHPPSLIRFELAMIHGRRVAAIKSKLSKEEFHKASWRGLNEAARAYTLCGGRPLNPNVIARSKNPLVTEHFDKLGQHHDNVLAPKLKRFAHVSLHDPAEVSAPMP